jgi:hypothetical protein
MKSIKLLKAELKYYKSSLNLLQIQFRENPNVFQVWKYTIKCATLELRIKNLESQIYQKKSLLK